jgi:hypothetical protein
MSLTLELVLIPVSDPDRARQFYVEQAGFDLLSTTSTPPGCRRTPASGRSTTSSAPRRTTPAG